jgi:hypothetical protein
MCRHCARPHDRCCNPAIVRRSNSESVTIGLSCESSAPLIITRPNSSWMRFEELRVGEACRLPCGRTRLFQWFHGSLVAWMQYTYLWLPLQGYRARAPIGFSRTHFMPSRCGITLGAAEAWISRGYQSARRDHGKLQPNADAKGTALRRRRTR